MTPDDQHKTVPLNPVASARPEAEADSRPESAEQGPAPADFASRPRSGVPVPTGEALPGDVVAALVDEDAERTDATNALQDAEGRENVTES